MKENKPKMKNSRTNKDTKIVFGSFLIPSVPTVVLYRVEAFIVFLKSELNGLSRVERPGLTIYYPLPVDP